MRIEEYIPLSAHTTFKVGGPARFFVTLESSSEIPELHAFIREHTLPHLFLGSGSNVLASDDQYDRVVIVQYAQLIQIVSEEEKVIEVSAGTTWDHVVQFCVDRNWQGIENLSAIPGTMGGAVVQNIGAYGAALSSVLIDVTVYDFDTAQILTFTNSECQFGYRDSIFKHDPDRYLILNARLQLKYHPVDISYKDLAHWFQGRVVTLARVRDAVIAIRAQKFPPLSDYGTAGSFFLNPIMSTDDAARIAKVYPTMPTFQLPEGGVKVPLAWFLDHVLNIKGLRHGGAHVWRDQALVLASDSGATSSDVRTLAKIISERVFSELQIKIYPEVRFLV